MSKELIIISGGHYKEAPGAVNAKFGLTEYTEMQKVMPFLADYLRQQGFEVLVTEGHLSHKIAIVNTYKPILALDCHLNADAETDDTNDMIGYGAETVFCPRASVYGEAEPGSSRRNQASLLTKEAALFLEEKVRGDGAVPGWYWGKLDYKNRPIYKDAFTKQTNCPAFIPEVGFIDNNGFAQKWLVAGRHDQLGEALGRGAVAVIGTL